MMDGTVTRFDRQYVTLVGCPDVVAVAYLFIVRHLHPVTPTSVDPSRRLERIHEYSPAKIVISVYEVV